MAAMEALVSAYGDDSDSEGNESPEEELTADHTAHLKPGVSISQLQSKIQLKSAPVVTAKVGATSSNEPVALEILNFRAHFLALGILTSFVRFFLSTHKD